MKRIYKHTQLPFSQMQQNFSCWSMFCVKYLKIYPLVHYHQLVVYIEKGLRTVMDTMLMSS